MSKKYWNTVVCNREADEKLILEWIDDSYDLVFGGLTKRLQHEINSKA
jgi:predicted DNA-binding protein (MmcQ/YjbR family)